METSMAKNNRKKAMAKSYTITCFLSKIDHPAYFLNQIRADPVLNIPEKHLSQSGIKT